MRSLRILLLRRRLTVVGVTFAHSRLRSWIRWRPGRLSMNYRTGDRGSSNQIVVIGESSGGLDALQTVARGLSHDFPAPICAVIHTSPDSPGVIHEIIGRATDMVTVVLRDAQNLEPGKMYSP